MPSDSFSLTSEEQRLIERYLPLYRALETGAHIPISQAQEHFVSVCLGLAPAQTAHERAYAKYRCIRQRSDERQPKAA